MNDDDAVDIPGLRELMQTPTVLDRPAQAHPAQFSPSIIEAIATLTALHNITRVFDPFAGPGNRLAELCDREPYMAFEGTDIEDWPGRDPRVEIADATLLDPETFRGKWVITSPTYGNGINDHFQPKDESKRYTYRIALGHPLDENNSGRYGIRGGRTAWNKYWLINERAVAKWHLAEGAIVNVKDFFSGGQEVSLGVEWSTLLHGLGFKTTMLKVPTPGMRNGDNRELRADGEWLIVATR